MLAIVTLFGLSVSAMASSQLGEVNGHKFTATTSISEKNAFAGTLSSSPYIYATVNATYYYRDPFTGQSGNQIKSASGTAAASVSFNTTGIFISDLVVAYHTAFSGGQTWTGYTSADYPAY